MQSNTPRGADSARRFVHEDAVLEAEVRRLIHALRPFGILRRDVLERRVGAAAWHDGGFDRALRAAVKAGHIRRLPLDFYGDASAGHRDHQLFAG